MHPDEQHVWSIVLYQAYNRIFLILIMSDTLKYTKKILTKAFSELLIIELLHLLNTTCKQNCINNRYRILRILPTNFIYYILNRICFSGYPKSIGVGSKLTE